MTSAAALMTRIEDGTVEMLPTCPLKQLLGSDARLQQIADPTGIVLNSLLVLMPTPPGEEQYISFAHRAFQEYFLARAIYNQHPNLGSARVPVSIQEWVDALYNSDTAGTEGGRVSLVE